MSYRIGIDVGGTFTDFLLVDSDGRSSVYKTPSTPDDPSIGVMNGLQEMADDAEQSIQDFAENIDLIVHGTTVTTNAVLTRSGVKTGLLTTEGFRDILEMRRGYREELYNNKLMPPEPLIPRHLRLPVKERIDIDGNVITPLGQKSLEQAIDKLAESNVESIVICFMHAYTNDSHEQAAKTAVKKSLPEKFLTVSSELLPKARIYERVSTATLNSYVGPILRDYLNSLEGKLGQIGFEGVLLIMQSNGGVATPKSTVDAPAMTLLSGPAGGPVAGINIVSPQGYDKCFTVDMGGTSFDAAMVQNGEPLLRGEGWINRQMLALPMLDIHTIGAGGGSIAWIDDGGRLHMGPQSAGADPGPACYGHGGKDPTCSDANLVLGYLSPDFFLGGKMKLDAAAAELAIKNKIADPLGLSIEEAAAGIYNLMNVNMAAGLREISVRRGLDPREFPLVVAGGAGPIHGALIAREMEMPVILVPRESSIFCASGMLRSDFKHSYVRTYHALASAADTGPMVEIWRELDVEGRKTLKAERVEDDARIKIVYGIDMRYFGQHNEITFDIDADRLENDGIDYLRDTFHDEHNRLYGYDLRDMDTDMEIVNLRVTAIGMTEKAGLKKAPMGDADPGQYRKDTRAVWLPDERTFRDVPVFDGDALTPGNRGQGPAIVEQITTTTFVPAGYHFIVDGVGTLCLFTEEARDDYLKRVLQ